MNILAIGAHFDDIELGCGGALAKHVAQGDKVWAYVATLSGFKNGKNSVVRTNEIAQKEGRQAMDILGVNLVCGNFETLTVEFEEKLNLQILNIIEDKHIEQVYTHWVGDIHHDHQAVARGSLHSCRHVPRILMYRSNWYHSNLEFRGNFYVDTTDYLEKKIEAVSMHKSELERTHQKWISFFRNEAENAGQRIGVKYAEVFEVLKWLN
jgi:LmbE family N-acetylglucosaminyl deacetylase